MAEPLSRGIEHLHPREYLIRAASHPEMLSFKGDLHAENFGTYIDRFGTINFDVNDFDEVIRS